MRINGIEIDKNKLRPKADLIKEFELYGACDRVLAGTREYYQNTFGNELIWHYPISDDMHTGVMIVVVKEGFLSLPYDEVHEDDYEIFVLDHMAIFDEDAFERFIFDWLSFSNDLLGAMTDMRTILQTKGREVNG